MPNRNSPNFQPGVVELEPREVPAILGTPQLVNGVLTVRADDSPTTIVVTQRPNGSVQVIDVDRNRTFGYAPGQVRRVDLIGGPADDHFTARGNGPVLIRMFGRGGNDVLIGGPGRDVLVGGGGHNVILGRGGNDRLIGGWGNDIIIGGPGNDIIEGRGGDDLLISGPGTNAISGGDGDDVIIAINGNTTDRADGGNGFDILWIDRNGTATDDITGDDGFDVVHVVDGFANGASRNLDGGPIPDPIQLIGTRYENYRGYPLFGPSGPRVNDIAQGLNPATGQPNLDNSWLLAAIGSVAHTNPALLRSVLADFGDGTFGAFLNGNYYRLDADLPARPFGNLAPAFAQVGQGIGMWAAIFEKVFAHVQASPGPASYAVLNGTGGPSPAGSPSDVFQALGYAANVTNLDTFFSVPQLGVFLQTILDAGNPAVLVVDTPSSSAPLVAGSAYSIVGYNLNNLSEVQSVVLYNPIGFDGGGNIDLDPNDGFLTVNLSALFGTTGRIEFGT